jgi:7-cyano-7-deazaguanine synthase
MSENKKSIILLSGGLDSLTCLAIAKSRNEKCYGLSFSYGQKHDCELIASQKIAEYYNIEHKIINIPDLGSMGGSSLTQDDMQVPSFKENSDNNISIPNTYVPCRNLIFLSFACAYSEVINADKIYIGVNAVDYSGYPDCRLEFINAMQNLINIGTKMGAEDNPVILDTPLQNLSKTGIIKLGDSLSVDYSMSVSCYNANNKLEACGKCDSCVHRKTGFINAGIKDPTKYISN